MQLNYIINNLEKVMYLKPYDIENKRALFAMIKEDEGIYKKIQITKEQSKMTFPFEPLYWFYQGQGYFYLKHFIVIGNWLALNINHLDGFKQKQLNKELKNQN